MHSIRSLARLPVSALRPVRLPTRNGHTSISMFTSRIAASPRFSGVAVSRLSSVANLSNSRGALRMPASVFQTFPLTSKRCYSAAALPSHTVLGLPALSPSMEQGGIVSWSKKEGDFVSPGDVIAEIETDKAVMAWEAVEEGYIAKILVPAGAQELKVNVPVVVIVSEQSSVPAFADFSASAAPAAAPAAASAAAPAAASAAAPSASVSRVAPVSAPTAPVTDRVISSPRARSLASRHGVHLASIRGTGPDGRIVEADVLAAVSSKQSAPAPASAAVPAASIAVASGATSAEFVDLPISNVRKVIASRLLLSKTTIPHYYLTMECNVDELLRIRTELNAKSENKISVNDFIIKAAALSLKKVPEVNSAWMDSVIRRYSSANINVAISTDNGLYSPLIQNVERLGLSEINSSVRTLAGKAKENRLHFDELQSGTFTISNLGMFGIKQFAAVINPPQACILATGTVDKRVVVNEEPGRTTDFKVSQFLTCTLSCDHRVVDGAVGAKWLQVFKKYLEDPLSMLL